MKNRKNLIITASLLIGIVMVLVFFQKVKTSNNDAGKENHSVEQTEMHRSEEEKIVRLNEAEMNEFGIKISTAGSGKIKVQLSFPGEVVTNADRLVHVVPRVPGIVLDVRKNLGDYVQAGEVIAILESRELADAKAAFLAAMEREKLTRTNFIREETLWKKKISAEQDYLEAKRALADAVIELRSSEQKLHVLGFSDTYLSKLTDQPEVEYTKYVMTAPASGTIIQKHITRGEVLKDDTEAFVVADLSTVWVNKHLPERHGFHQKRAAGYYLCRA